MKYGVWRTLFYLTMVHQMALSPMAGPALSTETSPGGTAEVLLQPNISLWTPNGWMSWGHQGSKVTRGQSFSITCSIQPQHPGGEFHLYFSGSNITETKPSVNHSATFTFLVAEDKDQGSYSCSYEVNVSSRTLKSTKTELLTVNIQASIVPLILYGGIVLLVLLLLLLVYLVWRKKRLSRNLPTETNQGEAGDYRLNRWDEEAEDEQDYGNVENVCYQEAPRRVNGDMNNVWEEEDDYVNVEEDREENFQNNYACGGSRVTILSDDDGDDYVNVSAEGNAVAHDVNEDIYENY